MQSPYETAQTPATPKYKRLHEDWLVVGIGALALLVATFFVSAKPANDVGVKPEIVNTAKGTIAKLESWKDAPGKAFFTKPKKGEPQFLGGALLITFAVIGTLLMPVAYARGISPGSFLVGYLVLFLLAIFAFLMSTQEVVKQYNFEYVLWALLLGLTISNTIGTPDFLKPMVIGDTFIKLGLVLFGAEVLFGS